MNAINVQFKQEFNVQDIVDNSLTDQAEYLINMLDNGCMVMEELDVLHIDLSEEGTGLA